MTMRRPTREEFESLADDLGFTFDDDELAERLDSVSGFLNMHERIREAPAPEPDAEQRADADRPAGREPRESEDPHNAWITRCRVEGAETGVLSGKTVALKDNVSLAGVRMTSGSRLLSRYVPPTDATVVTRLLAAGADVVGKTNLHGFCFGASDFGPTRNPFAPEYSIGGSSSGSAAAVAAGEADVGIGTDQGGSVRVPACFGGLVGVKPTHGLVPYTGVLGADDSLDHVGPITRSVEDAALATQAMAGRDGLDPRQPSIVPTDDYRDALDADLDGTTVGLFEPGFEHEVADDAVCDHVEEALQALREAGAEITTVSAPLHDYSVELSLTVLTYGFGQLLRQGGTSTLRSGWYDTALASALGRAIRTRGDDLPDLTKDAMLVSEFVRREYEGTTYGKAQNLVAELREQYDDCLREVDALAMPTVPGRPAKFEEYIGVDDEDDRSAGFVAARNTASFNLTHHPAMSVPCGTVEGAPVGAMFVTEHFDEATMFRVGRAFEQYRDQ